jgi:hypothetical protein
MLKYMKESMEQRKVVKTSEKKFSQETRTARNHKKEHN